MIVLLHVIIALASVGFTTYAFFRPSTSKLHIAYSLAGMTFASGVYMVWSAPVHIMHACISGLIYLGLVSIGIVAAKIKLATLQAEQN